MASRKSKEMKSKKVDKRKVRAIERAMFQRLGALGGKATGPTKRRGDKAYYQALAAKSVAARKKKKRDAERGPKIANG